MLKPTQAQLQNKRAQHMLLEGMTAKDVVVMRGEKGWQLVTPNDEDTFIIVHLGWIEVEIVSQRP